MTDDERAEIRTWVGAEPTDAELDAIWARLEDVGDVVRAVLRRRLADLVASPASVTIPGEVSVNTAANIKALQDRLALVDDTYGPGGGLGLARVVPAPDMRPR